LIPIEQYFRSTGTIWQHYRSRATRWLDSIIALELQHGMLLIGVEVQHGRNAK